MNSGERIRSRRKHLKLTQVKVGKFVGVTSQAVGQWESGNTKNLKGQNLLRLAVILKTSISWILSGKGNEDDRGDALTVDQEKAVYATGLTKEATSLIELITVSLSEGRLTDSEIRHLQALLDSFITEKTK